MALKAATKPGRLELFKARESARFAAGQRGAEGSQSPWLLRWEPLPGSTCLFWSSPVFSSFVLFFIVGSVEVSTATKG